MSRFNIALLGEEIADDVTPEATDATLDTIADSPEPEIAEANEVAGDLQDADAAAAEAEEVAETLDAMAGPIEAAQAEGGLTEPAAEAIRIAVEHMKSRIGMSKRKTFAMEGFKSKTTRAVATEAALDDIKATAKKIWEAIVKAFNTAIEWCKKFFSSLFDGATKLKDRAEKIKEAAKAKAGKPAGKEKLKSPSYAEKLRKDNKVVEGAAVASELSSMVSSTSSELTEALLNELMKKADALLAKVEDIKGFDALLLSVILNVKKSSASAKKFEGTPEGMVVVNGNVLLGDRCQYSQLIEGKPESEKLRELLGKQRVFMDNAPSYKVITNTDMSPATPDDAGKIGEAAGALADYLISLKGELSKVEAAQKNLQVQAKKLASGTKDDAQKNAKCAAQVVKMFISLSTTSLSQLRSHQINVGNAALNYAAASLSAAGGEEKPAKAK